MNIQLAVVTHGPIEDAIAAALITPYVAWLAHVIVAEAKPTFLTALQCIIVATDPPIDGFVAARSPNSQ